VSRQRGVGLATVVIVSGLAFFLLTIAVGSGLWMVSQQQRYSRYEHALRYAQCGFQAALSHLQEDDTGQWSGPMAPIKPLPGHPADAGAVVRFGDCTKELGVCENRLTKVDLVTSKSGVTVPKGCVYLSSTGHYAGQQATVEGVIHVSEFPFALASSGPLKTSGSFLVGAVENASVLGQDHLERFLKRGSLLSNAAGVAVQLDGAPVHVTGDVVTAGSVRLGSGVLVDGSLKEHREPRTIPTINLQEHDPADQAGVRILESNHLTNPDVFEGYVRASGPVEIDGELQLQEAIVYVDGSLTVRGRLSGVGALFCTGPVRLESSSIGALSQLAIVSGGDLSITGRGKAASRIAGLLVSKGNLTLSDVTVVGCVLCAGSEDRVLSLHNVDAFGSPEGTHFEFSLGWGGARTSYSVAADPARGPGGLVRLAQVDDGHDGKRKAVPADFTGRYDSAQPNADLLRPADFEVVELDASGQPVLGPDGNEVVRGFAESGLDFRDYQLREKMLRGLQGAARTQAQAPAEGGVSQGKLSLDLNKFLKVGETLQVVYRRIH